MKPIIICFDIDGTLLNNDGIDPGTPSYLRPRCGLNLEVVTLLQIFGTKFKNVKVYVWSGGGRDYAGKIVEEYGLKKYIHGYFGKADYDEKTYGHVDICFDDVQSCGLADKNLIVRMK